MQFEKLVEFVDTDAAHKTYFGLFHSILSYRILAWGIASQY